MSSKASRSFDRNLIPPAPDLAFEKELWVQGLNAIAGLDEAGRGAWAGPVAAAAVILPPDLAMLGRLAGVRDSKEMTPRQRQVWAGVIQREAVTWGVGMASNAEIDAFGILFATRAAMGRALARLSLSPVYLLVDYLSLPDVHLPQLALVKGDARSLSIACASVLAKTSRDAWMEQLDQEYPGYGFARHKGYGTRFHRKALSELGPAAAHRLSFAPLVAFNRVEEK